jgi:predicted nucleotidyltransferase
MDLTVHGAEASLRLKGALLEMRDEQGTVQPFTSAKKEIWSRGRAGRFPLSFGELMEFAERRWNYGIFMDTYFSVHPVRTDEEMTEEYGDRIYTQLGAVKGRGIISDGSESIYLPALNRVEDVESENPQGAQITEIVSYEGLYCDMFDPGDRVEFSGVLEQVTGDAGYLRVVIGGAGSEPSYVKRAL